MSASASGKRELAHYRLLARLIVRLGVGTLLFGGVLFWAAGSFDWPMAWVYLGLALVGIPLMWVLLAHVHPDLLAERFRIGEGVKPWDKILSWLMGIGAIVLTLVVAGLDRRWGWPPVVSVYVEIAAAVLFVLGISLVCWSMASNRFFTPMVRIQKDRGHTVESGGPYRIVRHPGYAGITLGGIAIPLMLGSLWGLVPAAIGVGVTVLRTALEDRTLRTELEGYREYADRVPYRLVPGVW